MEDKFEYFMEQTNKRLDKIDEKLETLIAKENKRTGFLAAVSGFFGLLWAVLLEVFKRS